MQNVNGVLGPPDPPRHDHNRSPITPSHGPWPDTVQRRPIADLIPSARNARTHSDAQVAQIAASIREWGWTSPVLIDAAGTLIAGHGRVLAARQLGLTEVPAMTATGWTDAQIAAYRLADNQLALNAGWDGDMLRGELEALKALDFDLALTGFSDDELAGWLVEPTPGLTDPDDVPEPPADPVTRLGDVWCMGRHRLVCGDATEARPDVASLTCSTLVDLCFTSPPYLQQRDYKNGGIGDWDGLMQGVFAAMPVKDEAQLLVNLGMVHRDGEWLPYWDGWIAWMREQGWRRFGWYVWDQGPVCSETGTCRLAPRRTSLAVPLQPRGGTWRRQVESWLSDLHNIRLSAWNGNVPGAADARTMRKRCVASPAWAWASAEQRPRQRGARHASR